MAVGVESEEGKFIDQPLWMPKGSVRSAITLLLTAVACMIWATSTDVPETLKVALMTALAFYFGMRKES